MTAPSSVTFADLLRHHRTAAGLTQEELAARAQLSVDAISTLERGARRRPRKDTVALLADALALPDEERAAFAAAARQSSAALVATPPSDVTAALDGHAPASDGTLPHGVVTFLFADIEGSTHLFHHSGDRYAGVLAEMQALLRSIWAAHGGHELGAQEDHFFAVFANAGDALAAAAAAQQALAAHPWPDGARVRLRMGVHSGAALLTAGRYVGLEVNRTARIAAAGHGGQTVVSGALAEQVTKFDYELPDGARLRSLGKHRLQDLPHREQLYQLVVPGQPANYPPLRTLDAWPGLRADLTAVMGISAVLLAVVGLVLPLVVPSFPWAIGLGAAVLAVLMIVAAALAQPVRRALEMQWRTARKPVTAVAGALLSLTVVSTTLFITTPPVVIGPAHLGYDFSYIYHGPTRRGGTATIWQAGPWWFYPDEFIGFPVSSVGLWQSCVTRLPDTTLGLAGWKADQCTEVPTIANGGESPDYKTTIFHIDPRAVWSDGVPITADDYLFAEQLAADPKISGGIPPSEQRTITALDAKTVRIDWSAEFGSYLNVLMELPPVPLHVYATGRFSGVYNPQTGAYNSALANALVASANSLDLAIPVDDGPFTVKSLAPDSSGAVLVRNTRFFSNFYHAPALDRVTLVNINPQFPHGPPGPQLAKTLITQYRRGGVDLVEALAPYDMSLLGGIPQTQVIISPQVAWMEVGFNQRAAAPNAQADGGVSIFSDRNVRKAFVEAFDRCAAVRAQLGISNCADHNLFTDELTTPPAPDYDPTVKLPAYNPADAAHLMDRAGYPVVDGVRRNKDGKTPLQISISVAPGGSGGSPVPIIGQRMQQDWMRNLKIGVTLVLDPYFFVPQVPQGPTTEETGAFDIALYADAGDPDPQTNAEVVNLLVQSLLGIVDPSVVEQEQLGSQTPDADQRISVYRALQGYFARQFYAEPVFIDADITLTKPTLCNFKKSALFLGDLWNMADWYVAPSCP